MISDELFDKILYLEKQSGNLIEDAKKTAQQINHDVMSSLLTIKEEAEKKVHIAITSHQKSLEREEHELKIKYQKLYDDISRKVISQRDQALPEIIEEFKKEMMIP
jgi:hypothetical protein